MAKRNLYEELMEGVEAIKASKKGKITLKTHKISQPEPLKITSDVVRSVREELGISRAIFAYSLRVNLRTLENWEQGKAHPNSQAAALILMAQKYPDTLERLRAL